jgi:hypothetical protein
MPTQAAKLIGMSALSFTTLCNAMLLESIRDIAQSYNVSHSTISGLAP